MEKLNEYYTNPVFNGSQPFNSTFTYESNGKYNTIELCVCISVCVCECFFSNIVAALSIAVVVCISVAVFLLSWFSHGGMLQQDICASQFRIFCYSFSTFAHTQNAWSMYLSEIRYLKATRQNLPLHYDIKRSNRVDKNVRVCCTMYDVHYIRFHMCGVFGVE